MKKHITDEKTGISYTLCGDYYLPDLELKEQEEAHYGKYVMLRKSFLKENRPGLYSSYLLTGKLTAHLNEVDQQANERMEVLVDQMMEIDGSMFAFDIYLVKCCNSDEKVYKNNWYLRSHRHMRSQ